MDGTTKWELKANALEVNRATPVISADGTIFFAGTSGFLYAVNEFGITKWSLSVTSAIYSTPVLAQDGSIFLVSGLYLCAISPDGRLVSKSDLKSSVESSPTLAPDGTVIVATNDGRVLAFAGGHGALMNSPWPKYQADLANSGNARFATASQ
jgi:outer membrane protein assembly factor BamB